MNVLSSLICRIRSVGSPASWSRLRVFRYQQYRGLRREVLVLSYLPWRVYLQLLWFCFIGQPRTVQEYVRVRVQSPTYIGYSPADDLSDTFEGWATLYRIATVERSLTRCLPPWRSECCRITPVHPCREDQSIRIVVSMVTGRFMLKPDHITRNYYY